MRRNGTRLRQQAQGAVAVPGGRPLQLPWRMGDAENVVTVEEVVGVSRLLDGNLRRSAFREVAIICIRSVSFGQIWFVIGAVILLPPSIISFKIWHLQGPTRPPNLPRTFTSPRPDLTCYENRRSAILLRSH